MFNWFKRFQQPDQTPETPESPEVQTPEVAPEPTSAVDEKVTSDAPAADDYLAWAKAAYQNIQKQKEEEVEELEEEIQEVQGEVLAIPKGEAYANEPELEIPESESIEPEVPEIAEVPIAPDLVAAVQDEAIEPALVDQAEIEAVTDEANEAIEPATVDLDQVEPEVIELIPTEIPEPELVAPELVTPEPMALAQGEITQTEAIEINQDINQEANQEVIPTEAIEANVPLWARETEAERLARLESLVVEEPEPVSPEVEQPQPTTNAPDIVFDEGFLWSAQVLASQGRRPEDVTVEEISWLKRLRQGLEKTRLSLINQLKLIVGQGPLDKDAVEAIEALLLQADVGVEATDYIITTLQAKLREEVLPPDQAIAYLKKILRDLLDQPYQNNYTAAFVPDKDTLNIWMMTGVNGAGKTTTIGKLAHLAQKSGYSCLIGAADTFRAAAVEQVKIWGQRSGTEVIANPGQNTDPGSVVFDAIAAAQARNTELLLIDTAGRLQNKKNLMDELGKIRRIVDKKAPNARVESLLVLDATLGQNGLRQAQVFAEAAKLSGVVLTKLDGTAKGGVALAVVQQLGLPIRFIGAGEGIEDLRPFSSYEFVEALLNG